MEDILCRVWENLVGRTEGPMKMRLILQPLVAILLAIRAGLRDARQGKAPFLWSLISSASQRRELLRNGWKDIGRVFIVGVSLDVVYQLIVLRMVYPGEAMIVAVVIVLLPYLAARGLTTRLAAKSRGRR